MNTNTLKFWLALLGLFFVQSAFSQDNFLPGYVIKTKGDTIFGFIDYGRKGLNHYKVTFKAKADHNPISFEPSDLIAYTVKNEHYVSGIINTEISSRATNKLEESPQLNLVVDTVFLQTIFKGNKSLFQYSNKYGITNFYIKRGDKIKLLTHKKYSRLIDQKRVISLTNKYLGQLALYLNDCEKIGSKLKNTSYTLKNLRKLFQFYNECSPSDSYYIIERKKIKLTMGVLAGVSQTSLKFSSDSFKGFVNAGYEPSTNLTAGLFFDLSIYKK